MRMLLLLLAGYTLTGQPASVLDTLTSSMQDYARGITENRFDVSCKLNRFDPAGKLTKTKDTKHVLEFSRGIFKTAGDWSATWNVRGDRKTLGLEIHTDDGALLPVFVFSPAKRSRMIFHPATPSASGAVTVSFQPAEPCQSFKPATKGFTLNEISCGTGQILLDEKAAVPLRASLDGAGFPLVSGKESMDHFHVESEFEKVVVPGAKRPFIFPKRVIANFGFSGGKVTATCEYQPHTNKKR